MDLIRYLPFASTAFALAFAVLVMRRYFERGGLHLLLWGIGMLMYGLGTLAEAVLAFAYAPFVLYSWYLFGAILTPAWLGQGTIHLLLRRGNIAKILLVVLTLVSVFALLKVFSLPTHDAAYDVRVPVSGQYQQTLERDGLTRAMLGVFAAYGTIALVGGALYSAYIFWRKRIMPQRVLGNVFIAAGALAPALGGALVARGLGDVLFISELVGAIVMFAGFRLATTQQPVDVSLAQTA